MFDFERLVVYKKAKGFYKDVHSMLKGKRIEFHLYSQLRRSSLSILLNIAEGTGRQTMADKKHFFVIARGSVYESMALFDILFEEGYISKDQFLTFYQTGEVVSKMLLRLIQSQTKNGVVNK